MKRTLLLLISAAAAYNVDALKLRAPVELDPCSTMDCSSGLVCALAIPQFCNSSPCPKMPTCLPQNQTCSTNSCAADETCVLRSVTCVMAPCYPVRDCAKFPKCGANEEYNECSLSSPCEPNCKDSFPICTNVNCGPGACECKPGYFRHNGTCITKDKCPTPTCEKPNEVWNTCPSACTQTCRILRGKDEQMMCPAVCASAQCTCAGGYVRDDDWNCVKEADCPKEFKCDSPHEEYKECSTHCEPTCENRSPTCIESCAPAKCQCKPNYVRHEGHCLFALQCPLEGNSTISPHHPVHDRSGSAESEESSEKDAPSCASVRCSGNTVCSLKGGKPVCAKCGKNERMESCPNACSEKWCGEDEARRCVAMKMCQPQRCVCEDGFVRNMRNGGCIKKSQCPTDDNSTMHILPIFINGTKPLIRPLFPVDEMNGTMHIMPLIDPIPSNWSRPLVRPMYPHGTENGTMHILPHFENGTMVGRPQVRPMFPDSNSTFHTMPYPSNGTMNILPFFPPNNGSFHTMPVNENGTMHIMPHFENGTMIGRPQVRPMFPDSNVTFHTLPYLSNETVHILPFFPGKNGTKLTMPIENGTMHILPFNPRNNESGNGAIHIMPVVRSNASISTVCANHTCPEGAWCEETPVMCINIAGPCPPIPTCVSTTPRGGGARDQPLQCGKNEVFSSCAPRCQETCRGASDCVEAMVCNAGCVCKDKFKRDGNGVCVPNHKCWKTAGCQDNEIWHKCRPCEPTCTHSKEVCGAQCVSGCGCGEGFVRGPKGDCIDQYKCPKTTSNSTRT